MATPAYVHYGCGFYAPENWLNFDASPMLRLERLPVVGPLSTRGRPKFPANVRFGDIVRGLPLPKGGTRAVYCSHVLEHLSLQDFRVALANTRAILADRGIFRLVVPDLRVFAARYARDLSATAAIAFMTDTYLGALQRNRSLGGMLRGWLGNGPHLWMWDFQSMGKELQTAGFRDIRAAQIGDSEDPMFTAVEEEDRWRDAVGIQCYA